MMINAAEGALLHLAKRRDVKVRARAKLAAVDAALAAYKWVIAGTEPRPATAANGRG